jgi:hypothetical protein
MNKNFTKIYTLTIVIHVIKIEKEAKLEGHEL